MKTKLKCISLNCVLPSNRTLDILKIGVGTHNWMYVRKKDFHVSCTWYKSLMPTSLMDGPLCKNYKTGSKQALSKIKNQLDKKSIIYSRLGYEFRKHFSLWIFSLSFRWWSQVAETVQGQGGKIYMVKPEVKS